MVLISTDGWLPKDNRKFEVIIINIVGICKADDHFSYLW